ncbi:pyridine nucleotide-disulfide oxidoreductase [Sulfuricella sp. T08]|uniref:FAD-dependent oxidoreductase n=1 Tax=Sulfuricella sp. T08 TaxID=1632857 RepID=UPI000617A114|nr:FAD-dependent oxidoreductase [Sulfuricella sp. T08]GAO35977.1 pyridine nucleotide-disulfide oxidoreductase [Sulfuricella sp. T08]
MPPSLPVYPSFGLEELAFPDLFRLEGLQRLDEAFLHRIHEHDADTHARLLHYRHAERPFAPLQISKLLLDCAPLLEAFIAELFAIGEEVVALRMQALSHDIVLNFKKLFVQKRARKRVFKKDVTEPFAELDAWLSGELQKAGLSEDADRELAVARFADVLLRDEAAQAGVIEQLARWCVLAISDVQGQATVRGWTSFKLPQGVDHQHLVPNQAVADDPAGRIVALPEKLSRRDGFKLTDARMTAREVQGEIEYCIYCHGHDGDFCSKGFPEKKGEPERGFKINPLGVILTGCPLEEKISEMHALKRDGLSIAALAMAMVDNPMIPATGHRICNDCMKACIYQKQDPVDIPQIETRVLTDVLGLPWGVEIYDLLTRWNPLRSRQYLPKPYNGRKVLIAGMGPAGFTMAHHLTMEGCAVVGIDGLKIEPLPDVLQHGAVRAYQELEEELDTRVMAGFGGVAEYGITVRWDKNFLKLIYLSLARRSLFQVFGGVRLGGTLTLEDAWALGFDHVSIATGAGLPRTVPIENSLARGMRQSNDFLMALQLTGAAKATSLASLQVRMPAVVIGGGLTAIDTATEVQAYYIAQVEKTLLRYERLASTIGEARVREQLDEESIGILEEFLEHGRAVRQERMRAENVGEKADFIPLLRAWGGVTVVYRRGMNESPAYVRNHEEVAKALEEGIFYAEGVQPLRANLDRFAYVESLECERLRRSPGGKWENSGALFTLPARAIFVAAGATPNTIYEREHPGSFAMQEDHFLPHVEKEGNLNAVAVAEHCKVEMAGPFTSYQQDGHRVSFIGDTHPVFHGGVVKAIASAMHTYPQIMTALGKTGEISGNPDEYAEFRVRMTDLLQPRVVQVQRLSPSVIELLIRAPMAARNFRPGQFFRLQNFETSSPLFEGSRLQTEALALSGAKVEAETGLVTLMVLEVGASSRLCATLQAGDPVVLMGPTGKATELPENQTILVAAGRRGAAVMGMLGPALRRRGNRVLYFAGFRTADEVYQQERLEAAADVIVWCTASGHPIASRRPQDRSLTGNYMDILRRYAEGEFEPEGELPAIPLISVDRVLAIGSRHLLRMMREAMQHGLRDKFRSDITAIGSVPSPMQCMLQGVCAQCLQWHLDPATGKRTRAVFSCAGQDQPLQFIDLDNLDARLAQNSMAERLTDIWLDYLLARSEIAHV